MHSCTLPVGVSARACAIADGITDDGDLALAAAIFTQIGDTLATIAVQRSRCAAKDEQ